MTGNDWTTRRLSTAYQLREQYYLFFGAAFR